MAERAKSSFAVDSKIASSKNPVYRQYGPNILAAHTEGGQNFCPAGKTLGKPRLQILRLCLNVGCDGKPSRRFAIRLGSPGRQTVAQLFCEAARPQFSTFVQLGGKFWQSFCSFLQKVGDSKRESVNESTKCFGQRIP